MVFAETCRIIQFARKVNEKALEGHTIATINSNNVDFCEIQCFLNYDCVSYNFGPTEDNSDTYVCERNNSTDNKRLKPKAMYVIRRNRGRLLLPFCFAVRFLLIHFYSFIHELFNSKSVSFIMTLIYL